MLTLYISILVVLSTFGFHRLILVRTYLKHKKEVPTPLKNFSSLPPVTIQLPIYNEPEVVERLIKSIALIDYPKNKLQIQILDDSTDHTLQISQSIVKQLQKEDFNIDHIHRVDPTHYKAGALANGLKSASGDFIAIFDADFIPNPDFLKKTIHYFTQPEIGMVQMRWAYLNRAFSLLTRSQAALLDGHFQIEHTARNRSKCFFNFNGTGGIWRKQAILDAGNWQGDTLTEDLDLSYRAQMKGYNFIYLVDEDVPSELPIEIDAFRSQQHRWTLGSIQVLQKLIIPIFRSPLPWRVKFEAFAHLGANLCYPLLCFIGLLLVPLALRLDCNANTLSFLSLPNIYLLTGMISVLIFYTVAIKDSTKISFQNAFVQSFLGLFIGISLSLSNSIAVFEGFIRKNLEFKRTPKTGQIATKKTNTYVPSRKIWRSWIIPIETFLFLYYTLGISISFYRGNYSVLTFLLLFFLSFGFITFQNFILVFQSFFSPHNKLITNRR